MKKLLIILFIFFGCEKPETIKPVPVTPTPDCNCGILLEVINANPNFYIRINPNANDPLCTETEVTYSVSQATYLMALEDLNNPGAVWCFD